MPKIGAGVSNNLSKVLRRAIAHLLVGGACAALIWAAPHWLAVVLLGAGTAFFLLMDLSRLSGLGLYGPFSPVFRIFLKSDEAQNLSGAFYLMAGALVTAAVFPRELAGAAVLLLTCADPAASVVGRWKGRTRLVGTRTFEGSLACFGAGVLVALALFFSGAIARPGVLAAGVVATVILEALPWPVNDNLTLPIGSAAVMLGISRLGG
jgi:dolichol kinase